MTNEGVSRRHVLAGLVALGLIPGTTMASNSDVEDGIDKALTDSGTDDYGSGRARFSERSPVWSSVDLSEIITEETTVGVNGHWYDDEEAEVEVTIGAGGASMVLNMSPQRAREFATDLIHASEYAEQGEVDNNE